jgi:hypothetical protein
MRLLAVLLTCSCLAACNTTPTQSEQALVLDGEWRQRQAVLDVQAILVGMARAQAQAQSGARAAR